MVGSSGEATRATLGSRTCGFSPPLLQSKPFPSPALSFSITLPPPVVDSSPLTREADTLGPLVLLYPWWVWVALSHPHSPPGPSHDQEHRRTECTCIWTFLPSLSWVDSP